MDRKRKVKRLMALGVQRNDAAAFVTTYQAIVAAGKGHLLPDVLHPTLPAIPMVRTNYQPQRFAVTMRRSTKPDLCWDPSPREDFYKKLAKETGLALLDAGAITITRRDDPDLQCVEYRATITVVKEETA